VSYRYFAYGSALDATHFAEWAAEHGYAGRALDEGQPAVLDDYELAMTVPSRYWMGAVGTLEARPGGAVYGVLFTLPDDWADMVRHKEGVATGLYRETEVEVRLWAPGGDDDVTMQLMSASAFVVSPGRAVTAPPPSSQRWLDIVVRGAQARGLPDLWIAELKRKGKRP
jgi:cation transport regulator ChaC